MSQFFLILIFSQDIWGNIHYGRKIKLIFEGTDKKSLLSPKQNNLKKFEMVF